jgi:hypothetical protein
MSYGTHLKERVSTKYVTLIKDLHTNIMTYIRACDDEYNVFSIKILLHQRSILSFYIFTLMMDDATRDI